MSSSVIPSVSLHHYTMFGPLGITITFTVLLITRLTSIPILAVLWTLQWNLGEIPHPHFISHFWFQFVGLD